LRGGFLLIWLVFSCFALSPPAQAQLPNIFAANNPSGSVNSGGANIAYLQNTTGSDVTLTLDGNTIKTKANRLNIFDRSSGAWVQKVILNQQSQSVSPSATSTSNTFLTGLYAYYKLDEASGNAIDSSANGRTLAPAGAGNLASVAGVINTARNFPGDSHFFRNSTTEFSPGSNHFFFSFWARAGTLNQGRDASFMGRYNLPYAAEWLVYFDPTTHKTKFIATPDSTNVAGVISTTAFANTTNWYFIAGGWDGTNLKISVNGEPYVTTSFSGPVFQGSTNFNFGSESGLENQWVGQIDEAAIWIGRNDLPISEVQQLYNGGAGLPFSSFH
jgi:hypothetical protein